MSINAPKILDEMSVIILRIFSLQIEKSTVPRPGLVVAVISPGQDTCSCFCCFIYTDRSNVYRRKKRHAQNPTGSQAYRLCLYTYPKSRTSHSYSQVPVWLTDVSLQSRYTQGHKRPECLVSLIVLLL